MTAKALEGRISAELPPGRRDLAVALSTLYRLVSVATLEEAAELLASKEWRKDPSEISRYCRGRRVPPWGFIEALHSLAVERAGSQAVAYTLVQLRALHHAAEPRICGTCTPMRRELERLRHENSRLLASVPSPLGRAAGGTGASAPLLPVPLPAGDRQQTARDIAAARQLAATALDLLGKGQISHALSWLQDASSALSPLESAASIALLREEQEQLANAAISIHGRRRNTEEIIRIALQLHEYGLPDDAGALLRAAAG
ncbi:hypothetical protein ACF068_14090 [Streptomyces sp. NPDC016309]|uniref:hypothetical protein n=1 Tax=Streptomyces sp. NPDC016309 TaxID=3364965 RepID=UPI00370188E7